LRNFSKQLSNSDQNHLEKKINFVSLGANKTDTIMAAVESRGVAKLLGKIKDSLEEKKYYEGEET